jgi:pimeloyl-ACP methyl ester carboxylesterase
MERAVVDDIVLEYTVAGAGAGEPAVFIHGAFVADIFRPLLAEPDLADWYRLILYHRRGHAGSGRTPGPFGVGHQAADCRTLLRHLGVERAHVVGHSYGGAIALQLALDAPEVVHSLALLEPALMAGGSGQGYREALAQGVARYRVADAAIVVDQFLEARSPRYRALLDGALPGAFAQAVADAGTWFEYEVPGLLDWRFGEAEARRIAQPALSVLGGGSDLLWDRFGEVHRLLLDWLPHAEGVVLPNATHLLQLEDPRGTAAALAAVWERHSLAARPPDAPAPS